MQNNIPDRKVKILFLGYNDNPLNGHVLSYYQKLPDDKFDKRIVVKIALEEKRDYAFYSTKKWQPLIKLKFHNIIRKWGRLYSKVDLDKPEYSFHYSDKSNITAKDILKKNPNFTPDVIALFWTANFLNPKTIRKLHDLTKAVILFVFVDEAYLTGGCHYPNECEGYFHGCHKCPALLRGKNVASKQMAEKSHYWKDMPKIVYGVKSDCQMAKCSPLFKDALFIPFVSVPQVKITERLEARRRWSISNDDFVVLLGANYINEKRKGFIYAIEAINKVVKTRDKICLLLLGHNTDIAFNELRIDEKVKVIKSGFLSIEELFVAYCASDCYVSPSIADSGPMMVNYSIACGTPVISFNIGVARDIVLHKETGYIAKYKDSMDLARGLEWLYGLNIEYRQMIRERCVSFMDSLKNQKPYYDTVYDIVTNLNFSI